MSKGSAFDPVVLSDDDEEDDEFDMPELAEKPPKVARLLEEEEEAAASSTQSPHLHPPPLPVAAAAAVPLSLSSSPPPATKETTLQLLVRWLEELQPRDTAGIAAVDAVWRGAGTVEAALSEHRPASGIAFCALARAADRPLRDVFSAAFAREEEGTASLDFGALLGALPEGVTSELKSMVAGGEEEENAESRFLAAVRLRDRLTAELEDLLSDAQPQRAKSVVKVEAPIRRKLRDDASGGLCAVPIPVYNEVDDEDYDANAFVWIVEIIVDKDVKPHCEPEFLVGCQCERCTDMGCTCAKESHDSTFPYDSHGRVQLIPRSCIYECNSKCWCSVDPRRCWNRVIQRGSTCHLEIFRTRFKGWGVRTAAPIPRGTFVCEYLGELISSKLADQHGSLQDGLGCSYLFDLDLEEEHKEDCPVVDAYKFGGVSRFFNHSCDPNLSKYFFWINHLDKRFPRIAFFTSRDVAEGEELTFDYQYVRRAHRDKNSIVCRCGAAKCRKVLF